jgi:maltooligosyltrehalose trehalohydrolase
VGLGDYLAASALLLLLPETPLLFQGQEFGASTPFLYFTDHEPELGRLITEGRRAEFAGFRAFQDAQAREQIPDPQAEDTFRASVLRLDEATFGVGALIGKFYRDLLTLRREDAALVAQRTGRPPVETWTSGKALVARLSNPAGVRWLVVNFGEEERVPVAGPEARLATMICSDEVRYGGTGSAPVVSGGGIVVPAHSGALLRPA